jgi:formylglycine-generating enzyme required for sulfatase activity
MLAIVDARGVSANHPGGVTDVHPPLCKCRSIVTETITTTMQWIEGGTFIMGSDAAYPEEAPAHAASVSGFWIDRHPVTNRDFNRFVQETGHVTLAERPADPEEYPDADPALLAPRRRCSRGPSSA